jgi:hypothetical protein
VLTRSARSIPFITAVGVLVAACGASPPPAAGDPAATARPLPSASPSPSQSPAVNLVLRITTEGGFIGAAAGLAAVPAVSVYADGRIVTPGATPAINPGPLLAPVDVRDVGSAGAAAIIAAIHVAALDQESDAGPGIVGDTGSTVFAVTLDGRTVITRFAGLAGGPPGPGGPGAGGDPARAAALDLLAKLSDPGQGWGGTTGIRSPLRPAGFRVFVAPGAPPADAAVSVPPIAWPLGVSLAAFGAPAVPDRGIPGLRMGVVVGADAVTLGAALAQATQLSAFTSGGQAYTLYARPLLPDEMGG